MSSYSTQALQEKLSRLSLSQDSIETLSLWVIHHKAFAKTSVDTWLKNVQEGSPDQQLVLLYLANDILQNGRRKGAAIFLDLFRQPLKEAIVLTRGEKIRTSVERMFRIWKERHVYEHEFLKELELLVEPAQKTQPQKPTPQFKISLLEDAITELRKFEGELKVKSSYLSNLRMDASNTSSFLMLKDKSAGGRFSVEFDEASQKLQDYCECLGIEVNERINILDMLRSCKAYQEYRLEEVKKVAQDYKALSAVVDSVKEKVKQRERDLDRAQQTATSDPSAKEDITDSGDMEIESDNEAQDSHPPPSHPSHPPQPQPVQIPPMVAAVLQPPFQPVAAAFPPQRFSNPPPPQPVTYLPPNSYMQQEGPRKPHPLTTQLAPQNLSQFPQRPPSTGPPQLGVSYIQTNATPPVVPPLSLPHTNAVPAFNVTSPIEAHPSLDERLKTLIAHNSFPTSLLTSELAEKRDGGRDGDKDRPYSPSNDDLIISNTASPLDRDDDSLPTPTMESPTPEDASPVINMDNPIIQALYQSPPSLPLQGGTRGMKKAEEEEEEEEEVGPGPLNVGGGSDASNRGGLLSSVDTGFLQSVLSNVSKVVPPARGGGSPPSFHPPTSSALPRTHTHHPPPPSSIAQVPGQPPLARPPAPRPSFVPHPHPHPHPGARPPIPRPGMIRPPNPRPDMIRPQNPRPGMTRHPTLMIRPPNPRSDMIRLPNPRPDMIRPPNPRPDMVRPPNPRPDMVRPPNPRPDMVGPPNPRPGVMNPRPPPPQQLMTARPPQMSNQALPPRSNAPRPPPGRPMGLAAVPPDHPGSGGSSKDIQITPKLTSLLDEIFPQLSKSLLKEKKRKQEDLPLDSSTAEERPPVPKAPRIHPHPALPPPHSQAQTGPSNPQQFSQFGGPRPPMQPMGLQRPSLPRLASAGVPPQPHHAPPRPPHPSEGLRPHHSESFTLMPRAPGQLLTRPSGPITRPPFMPRPSPGARPPDPRPPPPHQQQHQHQSVNKPPSPSSLVPNSFIGAPPPIRTPPPNPLLPPGAGYRGQLRPRFL